jgi:hypothetical protein
MTEEHSRLGELSLYERLDILDIILKLEPGQIYRARESLRHRHANGQIRLELPIERLANVRSDHEVIPAEAHLGALPHN